MKRGATLTAMLLSLVPVRAWAAPDPALPASPEEAVGGQEGEGSPVSVEPVPDAPGEGTSPTIDPRDRADAPEASAAELPSLREQFEQLRREQAELRARVQALTTELETQAATKRAIRDDDDVSVQPERVVPQAYGYDEWTAGNAMATRVTFAFGDDNLLAGPRDRSPQPGFSLPDDQLFFENITQEKRGYETETQFVVYKRMPAYFKHLDAEAALVLEFQNFVNEKTLRNETIIGDDGSYLKLNYYIKPNDYDGDRIALTLFPFDSQRFLLGYTFDIAWGGERIFPNNTGQVPGARLKYDFLRGTGLDGYVFIGGKTARLLNDEINEPQTYYGALAGFGVHFVPWLMWEVNGGYFQRGAFPPQGVDYASVGGKTAKAFGASTRLTFHKGMPVGTSIDFRLFKYAPDATLLLTQPIHYDDGWAVQSSQEFTGVAQSLLDWEQPDKIVYQPSFAAATTNQFRWKMARFNLNGIFRDLSYVLFNIPGLAPYRAFPNGAVHRPEFFIAGGFDYYFPKPHLTPGFSLAYKRPATYTSGGVTTVIRDEDDFETLPPGENAFDIMAGKLTLRWDVAPFFVVVSELRYTLDKNRTKFVKSEHESGRERVFQAANVTNRLGFFILAQARW